MKVLESPYACAFCQDTFSTANALVSHVQNQHNSVKNSKTINKNIQDEIEDQVEKSNDRRIETFEKYFVTIDAKSSKQNSKETEKKKHKDYSCKNCHKTFLISKTLRQHHLRTHKRKKVLL